jgi:hypothetical protein
MMIRQDFFLNIVFFFSKQDQMMKIVDEKLRLQNYPLSIAQSQNPTFPQNQQRSYFILLNNYQVFPHYFTNNSKQPQQCPFSQIKNIFEKIIKY